MTTGQWKKLAAKTFLNAMRTLEEAKEIEELIDNDEYYEDEDDEDNPPDTFFAPSGMNFNA